jgi:hypothetical protein
MGSLSRRDFIKYVGAGAVGLIAGPRLLAGERLFLEPMPDVIQCYDAGATSGSAVVEAVVQVMMDESVKTLAGAAGAGEAWKSLFPGITTASVIGIKINCAEPRLSPHPATVNSIVNGLAQMDLGGSLFKRNNVIVYERTNAELTAAGFALYTGTDPDTMRVFGTNQSGVGYDSAVSLNVNGVTSHPSKILSQYCDYLIDLSVLKTHSLSDVTLGLKNHYGSVNNASSLQHTSGLSPALPALNAQIRDVITPADIQKVFIIDALFGLYSGGPSGSPNFNPKYLITSRDPVACDTQGQNVINTERQAHGLSQLNATHIATAAQSPYNLGSTTFNLIEILNPTGIEDAPPVALADRIDEVTPSVFRDRTSISLSLARTASVRIDLVDPAGAVAAPVYRGRLGPGRHAIPWHAGRGIASGQYFLRLASRGRTSLRKVTILN